jgi:tetratricopeptide (TPR) repeat protein
MQETDTALKVFERAAKAAQNQFAAQFNYGLALLKSGRTEQALPLLARAVELLPQSQEAQMTLGLAAVMARQYETAIPPLLRAHQNEPEHVRVTGLLATAYLRTAKPEEAAKLLQPLVASSSEPAPALLYIEALQASGKNEQAMAVARATYEKHPRDLASGMTLGTLLTRAGQFAQARPVFAGIVANGNAPPEAVLGLADCLQKAGEHSEALQHYKYALMYKAVTLPARLGLARSLIALHQFDEARRLLEEGVRDHKDEPALYVELARVYTRLRQPELAADATRRVQELKGTAGR